MCEVIIKGTQIYDSSKGSFVDLSVLDVLQVFGRAGRPGMETSGVGFICTTEDKLTHYLDAVTSQVSLFCCMMECGEANFLLVGAHRVSVRIKGPLYASISAHLIVQVPSWNHRCSQCRNLAWNCCKRQRCCPVDGIHVPARSNAKESLFVR